MGHYVIMAVSYLNTSHALSQYGHIIVNNKV